MAMASTSLTMAELLQRQMPDGSIKAALDIYAEVSEMQDARLVRCNRGDYHEDKVLLSKPSGTWSYRGEGYTPAKSSEGKITEPTASLKSMMLANMDDLDGAENPAQHLAIEEGYFMAGMTDTVTGAFFTGNRGTNPAQFMGLQNRSSWNALGTGMVHDATDGNADSDSDKYSIWFVQWGDKGVVMTYPQYGESANGAFGITRKANPEATLPDPNVTGQYISAITVFFRIQRGLFIHDNECVQRIVNLTSGAGDGVTKFNYHEKWMHKVLVNVKNGGRGGVFYCGKTGFEQIWNRASDKTNMLYQQSEVTGDYATKKVLSYGGYPIRMIESLSSTEAQVS